MNKVLKKISKAREIISSKEIKKDGNNSFSKYDYFTPSLVTGLVEPACIEVGILPTFSLLQDEYGLYGSLYVLDIESGESITTIMRTEKPTIKATNETQQMGGCETYTKRYMLMSMFAISDNTLDFDSQDNTKKTKKVEKKVDLPWFNEPELESFKKRVKKAEDKDYVKLLREHYAISNDMADKIKNYINSIK